CSYAPYHERAQSLLSPVELSPHAPKSYIALLHSDRPTRRPDAAGQSRSGSRKCGPGPSAPAGSVTAACHPPSSRRTRRETTFHGGVASAEGTPTATRLDGLFAPQAQREPHSAFHELA